MAERIRKVRLEHLGLTQQELAARLVAADGAVGIEQVNVSRWERGVSEPSVRFVRQIAEMADLPISWFFAEEVPA